MDSRVLTVDEVTAYIESAMYTKKKNMGENSGPPEGSKLPTIPRDTFETLDTTLQQNNLNWNIIVRSPFANRGAIGKLIALLKLPGYALGLCKTLIDQQRTFNASIARSINILRDLAVYHNYQLQATGANQVSDELNTNYYSFGQKHRGCTEEIKDKQKKYVEYFRGKRMILDAGCGRGEFLELLARNGISAVGVDTSDDMVNACREKGFSAIKCGLIDYLVSLENESLDGIFAAQVTEYLSPADLIDFIKLSYARLRPSGILVMETISPQCFRALSNEPAMDMSQVKLIHPLTYRFLLESAGFKEIKINYSGSMGDMAIPFLRINGATGNLNEFNSAIERLNRIVYGPQDYTIFGVK